MISAAAARAGLHLDRITSLENSQQAIEHLRPILGKDDVVLVKGSRGMRLDYIVAALEHRQ